MFIKVEFWCRVPKNSLPRVGVVHAPYGAATLRDIARAANDVCQPVIILREEIAAANPAVSALADRLFECVIATDGDLARLVHELGLVGLTTFHDGELDFVDRCLADLGMPGAPSVNNPWDKLVQRQVLRQHGLTSVEALAVDSRDDLMNAVSSLGFPGVLKPRRANTSAGLAMLDASVDIDHQISCRKRWNGLLYETRIPRGIHPSGIDDLADFVSVETVNTQQHYHIAVVDKLKPSLVKRCGTDGADSLNETGDILPTRLPATIVDEVLDYASRCLAALGAQWRITHTEIKLTSSGPELIEVNGRTAGYIPALMDLVGGPDLIRTSLRLALGQSPAFTPPKWRGHALLTLPPFPERRGSVMSTVSLNDLRQLPGVVRVDEIASAGKLRSASGFRMAALYLYADSFDELMRRYSSTSRAIGDLFAADCVSPS